MPARLRLLTSFAAIALLPALSGCGGGVSITPPDPSLAQRGNAAAATAASHPECVAAQPFYWSIGDAVGRTTAGRAGTEAPTADSVMPIASASKWLYAAWVAEQRGGVLTATDVRLLNFTSGYTEFSLCLQNQTVAECQSHRGALIRNGGFVAGHVGRFNYSGGHMQKHAAVDFGVGADDRSALGVHHGQGLGGLAIGYSQPQPAGGIATSAAVYETFLQRVVSRQLHIAAWLGTNAVCTNPATCAGAVYSPIAGALSWDYSIGHWVESDPVSGDGAFSSAGAFGFYPWIDASKRWWGVVARHDTSGLGGDDPGQRPARDSAACGGRIRQAWLSGRAP